MRLTAREVAVVVTAVLLLLAPFLAKPLHIDDPLFVWCAQHITQDPWDFYNFSVNWYGYDELMYMVTQNPPLVCYYLAAAGAVFGWHELTLHLAMAPPAVMAALGAYFINRRASGRPLLATLIGVATPGFLVSSTTLMCDVAMLAFWCWSVACWLKAYDRGRPGWLYAAGLLVALATLTKYYAVCLIPLLAAYSSYRRYETRNAPARHDTTSASASTSGPRWWHVVGSLGLAVAILVAYDQGTRAWYGIGLFSRATLYATEKSATSGYFGRQVVLGLAMLGACLPVVLFYLPRLAPWIVTGVAAAGAVIVMGVFSGGAALREVLGDGVVLRAGVLAPQLALFVLAGGLVLALGVYDFWRQRDALSALLILWLLGTYVFAGFVNWTTNARSVLPAAPVVGLLIVRQLERRAAATQHARDRVPGAPAPRWWARRDLWPLVPAVALALIVAWIDQRGAQAQRTAALELAKTYSQEMPNLLWFQGHWGFQYYFNQQPLPANPFNLRGTPINQGDRLIVAPLNTNPYFTAGLLENIEKIADYHVDASRMGTTVRAGTACLYGTGFGPMPFAFGDVGPDEYWIYRAKHPFAVRIAPGRDDRQPPDSPAVRKYRRLHDGLAPGELAQPAT